MDVCMLLSAKEWDEKHVSTSINPHDKQHDIVFRSNLEDLEDLYNRVVVHESASEVIQNSGLARFFEIRIKRVDQQLSYGIIERWWYSTNSFHFPNFEIGFTPLDFVHLSRIPIGNSRRRLEYIATNRWKSRENQELENTYFAPVHGYANYNKKSGDFPISCLAKYIKENPTNDENWEIMTRYFLLWVISKNLMARSTTRASKGWIASLRDLNAIRDYDWGSACFSHLYSSTSAVIRGGKNMCGMAILLEY
ncbi:protein MAIN-LIKE 1-like [Papaver somniferum]|uniref:protein MAIN-LIKE 1-like n=1 Tax=Papaver somniferum TaxID=3469 RepID=UPI000E6F4EB7|nr:protein MAIN-LIKE 1-like [Papaver somniferum]